MLPPPSPGLSLRGRIAERRVAGKTTEAVERHGHNQLKTFGVGKDRTPADWRGVLRQLQSAKLIERDENDRDRLIVTEEGRRVLRGEAPFALREDVVNAKARRSTRAAVDAEDADAQLLAALKALRGAIAAAQKQPAYVIFPDRTLIEMAKARPAALDELSRPSRRRRRQAAEIRRGLPRCRPGPFPCLSCRRSKPCGAASSRRCSAREFKGSNCAAPTSGFPSRPDSRSG